MQEIFVTIKDELINMLNPSAFTIDSLEGILIIALIIYMIYHMSRKTKNIVKACLGILLALQIGWWLSCTSLNNLINLRSIFKYDVLTSIAQVFVGTKICDILIGLNALIKTIFVEIANLVVQLTNTIANLGK